MDYEAYLISKKIDSSAFRQAEPSRWEEWKLLFEQISPASFTAQKLYLINPIRRKYLLKEVPVVENSTPTESGAAPSAPKPARPVFKPKIK